MIDYLTFIEELKKIRETNNTGLQTSQTIKLLIKLLKSMKTWSMSLKKIRENRKYMG